MNETDIISRYRIKYNRIRNISITSAILIFIFVFAYVRFSSDEQGIPYWPFIAGFFISNIIAIIYFVNKKLEVVIDNKKNIIFPYNSNLRKYANEDNMIKYSSTEDSSISSVFIQSSIDNISSAEYVPSIKEFRMSCYPKLASVQDKDVDKKKEESFRYNLITQFMSGTDGIAITFKRLKVEGVINKVFGKRRMPFEYLDNVCVLISLEDNNRLLSEIRDRTRSF